MKQWYITKVNSKSTWDVEAHLRDGWEPFSTTTEKERVDGQLQPATFTYLWLRIYK